MAAAATEAMQRSGRGLGLQVPAKTSRSYAGNDAEEEVEDTDEDGSDTSTSGLLQTVEAMVVGIGAAAREATAGREIGADVLGKPNGGSVTSASEEELAPFVLRSRFRGVLDGIAEAISIARSAAMGTRGNDWEGGLRACERVAEASSACVGLAAAFAAWTSSVGALRSRARSDLVDARAVLIEAQAEIDEGDGEGSGSGSGDNVNREANSAGNRGRAKASEAAHATVHAASAAVAAANASVSVAENGGIQLRAHSAVRFLARDLDSNGKVSAGHLMGRPGVRAAGADDDSDDLSDAAAYVAWIQAAASSSKAASMAEGAREAVRSERTAREQAEGARAQAVRELLTMAHEVIGLAGRVGTYHTLVPLGVGAAPLLEVADENGGSSRTRIKATPSHQSSSDTVEIHERRRT